MKKLMWMVLSVWVCLAACEHLDMSDVNQNDEKGNNIVTEIPGKTRAFTFTIKGDFGEELKTRGVLSANGTDMTDLWMLDYMGGELQQTLHLTNADANFDSPQITLAYGSHHIYIVCARGANPALDTDAKTIVWEKPSDTFWKDYTIDVTATSTKNRSTTLSRVATKLRVTLLDVIPDGLTTVEITPAVFYNGIRYDTGDAAGATDVDRVMTIPAAYAGSEGQLALSVFGLSNPDQWTTDVTITAKNAVNDVLGSTTVSDVPLVRNRATEMSGYVLVGTYPFGLTIDDEWIDSYYMEF